jgi:hypothetical protein
MLSAKFSQHQGFYNLTSLKIASMKSNPKVKTKKYDSNYLQFYYLIKTINIFYKGGIL